MTHSPLGGERAAPIQTELDGDHYETFVGTQKSQRMYGEGGDFLHPLNLSRGSDGATLIHPQSVRSQSAPLRRSAPTPDFGTRAQGVSIAWRAELYALIPSKEGMLASLLGTKFRHKKTLKNQGFRTESGGEGVPHSRDNLRRPEPDLYSSTPCK